MDRSVVKRNLNNSLMNYSRVLLRNSRIKLLAKMLLNMQKP